MSRAPSATGGTLKLRPFRDELKYLVHHSVKAQLMARWQRYLVPAPFTDARARTPILSQYYDSPTLTFWREKHDGIAVRNKIRLRVYGHRYEAGQTAFLEIKHRYFNKVRKYRDRIPDFGPQHLDPATWRFSHPEMEAAFQVIMQRHQVRRSAQVYYQREAWEGAVESDIRVTWDSSLVALFPGEQVSRSVLMDPRRAMMPDTLSILEVKSTVGIPPWVYEGVIAAELKQQTIPKYITAVELLGMPEQHAMGIYA